MTESPVPVIAIDGPSGSGKGTAARRVAAALSFHHLDSGALYRLVGFAADRAGIIDGDPALIARMVRGLDVRFGQGPDDEQIRLNGEDVGASIRTESCGTLASRVAAMPQVRQALFDLQQGFRQPPGLVADGRDMGTVVFPDAALKIFLTASAAVRAQRRYKQLKEKGIDVSLAALSRDIEARDRRDTERTAAPLRPAEDARMLDSSELTIDEVTRTILAWARELGFDTR